MISHELRHRPEPAGQGRDSHHLEPSRLEHSRKAVTGESAVVMRFFVQRPHEGHRHSEAGSHPNDTSKFGQHRFDVLHMLENLGAENRIEGPVWDSQANLQVANDVGLSPVHAAGPVLGDVLAMVEEAPIGRQPRSGVKDPTAWLNARCEFPDKGKYGATRDGRLGHEGLERVGQGSGHGRTLSLTTVPMTDLRIAVLGGIPSALGGGGLEVQRDLTVEALTGLGCRVIDADSTGDEAAFDVLHVFGSEPDVWHTLGHWRRNPAPLVISPVLVLRPGWREQRLSVTSRVRWPMTPARMRRDLLRRADLLIALTQHEAALLRKLAPQTDVRVIGNGVREVPWTRPELSASRASRPYVVLLGTVSRRKRQTDTLRALASSGWQPVVVGGFHGSPSDLELFEDALSASGARWLGDVSDAGVVRGLLSGADALVHFSEAEGQSLAMLEALSVGTPVVCSDLPPNQELALRYPGWVYPCSSLSQLELALLQAERQQGAAPHQVDSWVDVANALVEEYTRLTQRQ